MLRRLSIILILLITLAAAWAREGHGCSGLVRFKFPRSGHAISGEVRLVARARRPAQVVYFYIDGDYFDLQKSGPVYTTRPLDTASLKAGTHTLRATAFDGDNNQVDYNEIVVTVSPAGADRRLSSEP